MRGAIHGIWFVTPGGKLHPAIIPNLSGWVQDANAQGFPVILWSNVNDLDPTEIKHLEDAKIVIGNPVALKSSILFKYYEHFLAKGLAGDKSALAIASDILRMSILELTPNDKYFIYVDPNDITMQNLAQGLQNLDFGMQHNTFGFSFKIEPSMADPSTFATRNDVLIALKERNPNFFHDFLNAYQKNLENTYQSYVTPTTGAQAQDEANLISNPSTTHFFSLIPKEDHAIHITSQFGNYDEIYRVINSDQYLQTTRILEHGGTWFPTEYAQMNSSYSLLTWTLAGIGLLLLLCGWSVRKFRF